MRTAFSSRALPFVSLLVAGLLLQACSDNAPPRVLVFAKTAGFRHSSIAAGKEALVRMGERNSFVVDTTENDAYISEDSLRNYAAVVFLHTTGDILNRAQEVDLQRYIQAGGGFVGIHAAADAEYGWHWYGRLVGGYFASHPAIQEATLRVENAVHQSTTHLPMAWARRDEWYNFTRMYPDINVLLAIDESTYEGGTHGGPHPMSWYHEFDGGRSWYTALGHTEESYKDTLFLRHVSGGIRYAMDERKRLDYSRATLARVPGDYQLERTILTMGTLEEPTEIAVLPNLDVLIAQRRGQLLLYRAQDSSLHEAAKFDVYFKTNVPRVNAEEGLLGVTLDPDFADNKYVYVYYSPAAESVNRLSRFEFTGDSLRMSSEVVILDVPSQRQICCHTGGSLAFGKNRVLFLSTGDNTTPFDEPGERYPSHGFAPLDDRPGHLQYDAQRSSANTNDLRGKILRIRIETNGTYTIPEGNLFGEGTEGARPEIYVMGNRNPYRISVDPKNGYLYWGEVGPDAAEDSLETRGPRGYDEVNQARAAGNFGWPQFVGNNFAYRAWDYATGKSGAPFDASKPENNSRNNTGLRTLPPAQPAFIWYPYGASVEFPLTGSGGRTAMAGPVYYADEVPNAHANALPPYFNGKLFIYDWIRNWVMAVTMNADGDFEAMERILSDAKFAAPMDMELGPDGRLYVLEYGTGWFTGNKDAALTRIDYRGTPSPR